MQVSISLPLLDFRSGRVWFLQSKNVEHLSPMFIQPINLHNFASTQNGWILKYINNWIFLWFHWCVCTQWWYALMEMKKVSKFTIMRDNVSFAQFKWCGFAFCIQFFELILLYLHLQNVKWQWKSLYYF